MDELVYSGEGTSLPKTAYQEGWEAFYKGLTRSATKDPQFCHSFPVRAASGNTITVLVAEWCRGWDEAKLHSDWSSE